MVPKRGLELPTNALRNIRNRYLNACFSRKRSFGSLKIDVSDRQLTAAVSMGRRNTRTKPRHSSFGPEGLSRRPRSISTPGPQIWCRQGDSNTRPPHYECDALPTELCRHGLGGTYSAPRSGGAQYSGTRPAGKAELFGLEVSRYRESGSGPRRSRSRCPPAAPGAR